MPDIEFQHVNVLYEDDYKHIIEALSDFSLLIKKGSIHALIGQSGSGKTTVLNCLTGKVIYEGKILFGKDDLETKKIKDRRLSLVNQESTLYPNLTIYENILFPLKNEKMNNEIADRKVKEIAETLNISFLLTRKPKYLSLGQQALVNIAKALVKDSDIYLFDEPLSSIDKPEREKILSLLKKELIEKEKTVIYVSHNLDETFKLTDTIDVLKNGKLVGTFNQRGLLTSKDETIQGLLKELEEKHEQEKELR